MRPPAPSTPRPPRHAGARSLKACARGRATPCSPSASRRSDPPTPGAGDGSEVARGRRTGAVRGRAASPLASSGAGYECPEPSERPRVGDTCACVAEVGVDVHVPSSTRVPSAIRGRRAPWLAPRADVVRDALLRAGRAARASRAEPRERLSRGGTTPCSRRALARVIEAWHRFPVAPRTGALDEPSTNESAACRSSGPRGDPLARVQSSMSTLSPRRRIARQRARELDAVRAAGFRSVRRSSRGAGPGAAMSRRSRSAIDARPDHVPLRARSSGPRPSQAVPQGRLARRERTLLRGSSAWPSPRRRGYRATEISTRATGTRGAPQPRSCTPARARLVSAPSHVSAERRPRHGVRRINPARSRATGGSRSRGGAGGLLPARARCGRVPGTAPARGWTSRLRTGVARRLVILRAGDRATARGRLLAESEPGTFAKPPRETSRRQRSECFV